MSTLRMRVVQLTPLWLCLLAPFFLFPSPSRALALLGLPFLWGLRKQEKGGFIPRTILDWPILLMLMMTLVSVFATFDLNFSLAKLVGLLFHIAVYYAVIDVIQTDQGLYRSLVVYLMLGLVVVGLGLVSTDWLFKVPALNSLTSRFPRLIQGLPGAESGIHPNQLSGTLLWFLSLQISLLWEMRRRSLPAGVPRYVQPILWSLLVITIFTLFAAQSRAAWLALFLGVVVVSAVEIPWLRWLVLTGGTVVGLGVIRMDWSTVLQTIFSDNQQTVVGRLGATFDFRLEIWRTAVQGITDFPFTGMGMGTFREVARLLYPINIAPEFNISDAHNQWLQAALDLGLPGLVAFGAIWLGAAYALIHLLQRTPPGWRRAVVLGLSMALFSYFIFAFINIVALGAKPGVFFWWLLALIAGLYQQQAAEEAM